MAVGVEADAFKRVHSGITRILRLENAPVFDPTRYFAVNVLEPDVSDTRVQNDACMIAFAVAEVRRIDAAEVTPTVDAPDTSNPIRHAWLAVLFDMVQVIITIADTPVVRVTDGPTVARSAAEVDVVVSFVPMKSCANVRSTIEFDPAPTK